MFDNICTLPLTADVFTQAIHPSLPILSVGLSSGHVQTFRLPSSSSSAEKPAAAAAAANSKLRKSPRRGGFEAIETVWRTCRHKGSCRTACYSLDGETLYTAGLDGLCKAASSETGQVVAKVAIPADEGDNEGDEDAPSVLHTLSPQALLLGTDKGRLHVYDLRLKHGSKPSRTVQPHVPKEDAEAEDYEEPITSITPLAPTATSTSGTSKVWITTSGDTLAVTDLRKGVVTSSTGQGDPLFSSLNVPAKPNKKERILAGTAGGALTVWERGYWEDRVGSVVVEKPEMKGLEHDGTVDSLALVPREEEEIVAAGLGNGLIKLFKLKGRGAGFWERLQHDEQTVDGVTALGFDVEGRMISAGGAIIKVWCEQGDWSDDDGADESDEHAREDDSSEEDENAGEEGEDGDSESGDDDEDEEDGLNGQPEDDSSDSEEEQKRKGKRRKILSSRQGNHGIFGSYNLD